jgi:sarcosine oxidase subunit delta
MLVVTCPVCGAKGDETDFHYGGQAHIRRPATHDPANITDEEQRDYLFIRNNPKGLHFERWRCDRGCGKWFHAARDTQSPPEDLQKETKGPWAEYFKKRAKAKA